MATIAGAGPPSDEGGRLYDLEITKLFDEFADQVYWCVRRGLCHEDAEEIVNFSFMAARLHWGKVREYEYPVGYVMKTARNLRADALARVSSRPAVSLDDPATPDPGVQGSGGFDEDAWRLREALAQLTPREQQITVLYYWTGLPAKQIADSLGISPGHIGRTLSDARARLHRLLSAPPEHDENGHPHG
jgi:RNA polymerase sigma factor (sigma-70 family)